MRTLPAVTVLAVVAVIGIAASAAADVCKVYPIKVVTEDRSPALKVDVVKVLTVGGEYELTNFMKSIVPAALRSTGALPAPANTGTMRTKVVILNAKNCYIHTPDGKLPVSLKVVVDPKSTTTTRVNEDGHERFNGSVSNSQSYDLSSYFVTEFTATCRVTKFHTKSNYEYPIVVPATGTHHGFRWVDP